MVLIAINSNIFVPAIAKVKAWQKLRFRGKRISQTSRALLGRVRKMCY
jgi:hypothetical protein